MKVMVISPHPDDETLGAGGTLLRAKKEGNKIYWLNMTSMKENLGYTVESIDGRRRQIQEIRQFYQFDDVLDLQLASTKLEQYDSAKIIREISSFVSKIQPDTIILPDYNDAHSDHKCTFDWGYACTKVFRHPYVKCIVTMEIPSETDVGKPANPFIPGLYVDISNYIDKKKEAIKIYRTELGEHPFPRSLENIEAHAIVRGASAGVMYAEAFRVIKMIL